MSFEGEHSLKRFCQPLHPAQPLHHTQLVGLSLHLRPSKVMRPNFLYFFIFFLFSVREKTCQFWVLQEPHESLTTHIKQRDRHRERVGCSINSPVAAWMDRLHCFLKSHLCMCVKLSGLRGGYFIFKIPEQHEEMWGKHDLFSLISKRWLMWYSLTASLGCVLSNSYRLWWVNEIYQTYLEQRIPSVIPSQACLVWVSRLRTQQQLAVYQHHLMWKNSFSYHKGNSAAFHGSTQTFSVKPNIPVDECGCWERGAFSFFFFSFSFSFFQACRAFQCVGREEGGMYEPNNYLQPATAFHYPACWGKGELKGLFRKLSRRKADYMSSEPQLFCGAVDLLSAAPWITLPSSYDFRADMYLQLNGNCRKKGIKKKVIVKRLEHIAFSNPNPLYSVPLPSKALKSLSPSQHGPGGEKWTAAIKSFSFVLL